VLDGGVARLRLDGGNVGAVLTSSLSVAASDVPAVYWCVRPTRSYDPVESDSCAMRAVGVRRTCGFAEMMGASADRNDSTENVQEDGRDV
jgi:hypothetical protein